MMNACSADHEDQDVVLFNRGMLPAYYGLLRLCCLQSRTFTRQLANHQNLHWAFKNITPHPTQYSAVSVLNSLFNPLNPKLNPICYLLALLGAHHFLHVSRIRVKLLTRRLMSYIYIYIWSTHS